jgi:hypothetical protein
MSAATDFLAACVAPEGVRQGAVRQAQVNYRTARQAELALWQDERDAAQRRFDLARHDAEHPDFVAARQAIDRLQIQPDGKRLRDEMDRSIRQADRAFHEAVARLRAEHGLKPVF